VFVPYFVPIMVSSSLDDDSEDENPPPPAHLPPDESTEHEPTPTPQLPKWIHSTCEEIGDLVDDPLDQRPTRSQFQRASSPFTQVLETLDLDTFLEASGHLDWDTTISEEMANDTWDILPLPKIRNFLDVNGCRELSMHQMEVLKGIRLD
jgi:hypothetical protein